MRLYKMEVTKQPGRFVNFNGVVLPDQNKDEWIVFCLEKWGKVIDYFNPSEDRLYKSRSSALDKVRIVEFYGGEAQLLEAEVSPFLPVEMMNARRKRHRDSVRIEKLQAKIDAIANLS